MRKCLFCFTTCCSACCLKDRLYVHILMIPLVQRQRHRGQHCFHCSTKVISKKHKIVVLECSGFRCLDLLHFEFGIWLLLQTGLLKTFLEVEMHVQNVKTKT
ncbi:hypothetical protein CHARACLAT_027742 [Characodon lateralis]|uniref:Secreted protein n=1 Tax=Characodon lateralis TaxID=208331 RepID=A0ABU7F6M7_9TELE|nr:hypothetical protein [Characodon lateralis]